MPLPMIVQWAALSGRVRPWSKPRLRKKKIKSIFGYG